MHQPSAETASPLPEALLARTLHLLDALNLSYREIAEGAQVDKNWVAKLVQGHIEEPGVNKIQRVHDFLLERLAQTKLAEGALPTHSQRLGDVGNG